jgi:hypothetical protein
VLPIKKHSLTLYNEMNNRIFDIDIRIDMNVSDNARNVIEPISFHRFHGPSNWLEYVLSGCISFIPISYCLVRGDCASMCLAI